MTCKKRPMAAPLDSNEMVSRPNVVVKISHQRLRVKYVTSKKALKNKTKIKLFGRAQCVIQKIMSWAITLVCPNRNSLPVCILYRILITTL